MQTPAENQTANNSVSAPADRESGEASTDVQDTPDSGSGWTVWGLGDLQTFSGGVGASSYGGEWQTAYLGIDRRFGEGWLGGLALASGRGQAEYELGSLDVNGGRLRTDLVAVYPYARGKFATGSELWAVLGAGVGNAVLERAYPDDDAQQGGLSMHLAAAGLRHELKRWSGVHLDVLADAGVAELSIAGEKALAELNSTAHRSRVGLEVAGIGNLSPYLGFNARYDGGGEFADLGYEGEAGMRYAGSRVDFDVRGRWMALIGDIDYRESGAVATFTLKTAADGSGLFASLTPSWGRPGTSEFVWARSGMPMFTGATPLLSAGPYIEFQRQPRLWHRLIAAARKDHGRF